MASAKQETIRVPRGITCGGISRRWEVYEVAWPNWRLCSSIQSRLLFLCACLILSRNCFAEQAAPFLRGQRMNKADEDHISASMIRILKD
jgi:hypothetical protein